MKDSLTILVLLHDDPSAFDPSSFDWWMRSDTIIESLAITMFLVWLLEAMVGKGVLVVLRLYFKVVGYLRTLRKLRKIGAFFWWCYLRIHVEAMQNAEIETYRDALVIMALHKKLRKKPLRLVWEKFMVLFSEITILIYLQRIRYTLKTPLTYPKMLHVETLRSMGNSYFRSV